MDLKSIVVMVKAFLSDRKNLIISILSLFLLCLLGHTCSSESSRSLVSVPLNGSFVKLPSYPVRSMRDESWNKGVFVEKVNGSNTMSNFLFLNSTDVVAMYGWAIDMDRKCPASEIYMEVNGRYVKGIYGLPRPELRGWIDDRFSTEVGFLFYFDKKLLIDSVTGAYNQLVKFHMVDKEKMMLISFSDYYVMDLMFYNNQPLRPIEADGWVRGVAVDYCDFGTLDYERKEILYSNIDSNRIFLSGWAADLDNKTSLRALYVSVNNVLYKCSYGAEREYVCKAMQIENSTRVGFDVSLPVQMLKTSDNTLVDALDFYMEDMMGNLCEPIRYRLVKK